MMCMQPRCSRCGAGNYSGEVSIQGKAYSLCGYCLPVVEAKLTGFINDHLRYVHIPDRDDHEEVHNVFKDQLKEL